MADYFGYGVLGFGAGGGVVPITATGGDTVADYVGSDGFTYRYHQFTNTGNFVVVSLGSDETWGNKIDYQFKLAALVVETTLAAAVEQAAV